MSDLNDLNKPVTTDTEPNVLDTLRGHIARAITWTGYTSTANKVAGLMSAVTAAVTGGRSLRLYRRNDANTADEEVVQLPGISVGGNAATASAAQAGSTLETALAAKAPLNSPALTGTPTVPTAAAGTNTTQAASTAFVATAVANVVNTAPAALDTLNELATALGNDPNFATSMNTALANRVVKTSANRPGVTKLYQSDADSAYNVQATWQTDKTGYWSLRGYSADTYHAPVYVAFAGAAATAATATAAAGNSFSTAETTSEGQIIAKFFGTEPVYLFNNATQWGVWSNSGGAAFTYTRSSGVFNFSGNADTATNAATLNGASRYDLFGAASTGGTLDWNHVSNTKPGSSPTLLLGSAANGPGASNYYHPFNFEYASKNGTGNVTQMAIPYSSPDHEIYFRARYAGTWTPWRKLISSNGFTNAVMEATAGASVGSVGTYAFLSALANANYSTGQLLSGSSLNYRAAYAAQDYYTGSNEYVTLGAQPTGTWMLMGHIISTNGVNNGNIPSLWLRIA
jgi:hypothetical protein